jgi:hypothetical protein
VPTTTAELRKEDTTQVWSTFILDEDDIQELIFYARRLAENILLTKKRCRIAILIEKNS